MFVFYKIGKKSSFRLIAGFSHFVSTLVQRKKGVCEFVSRLSPFSCLVKLFVEIKFISM